MAGILTAPLRPVVGITRGLPGGGLVGLAAGIGYLGVALIMSMFFCFTSVVMWALDYGRNPGDEARMARKKAKLGEPLPETRKPVDL